MVANSFNINAAILGNTHITFEGLKKRIWYFMSSKTFTEEALTIAIMYLSVNVLLDVYLDIGHGSFCNPLILGS